MEPRFKRVCALIKYLPFNFDVTDISRSICHFIQESFQCLSFLNHLFYCLQSNAVTYDEGCAPKLQDKLYLGDAISEFPAVCIFYVLEVHIKKIGRSIYCLCMSSHFPVFCRWTIMNPVTRCLMELIQKPSFRSSSD